MENKTVLEADKLLKEYLLECKEWFEVENCEDFRNHNIYNQIPHFDGKYVNSLLELIDDDTWYINTLKAYMARCRLSYDNIKKTEYLAAAVSTIIIPYLIENKKNKGKIGELIKQIMY